MTMQQLMCSNCAAPTTWLIGVCAAEANGRQMLHLMCLNCHGVVKMKITPAQMRRLQSDGASVKPFELIPALEC